MKKLAGIFLVTLLVTGCNTYSDLDKFSWMLGSWSSTDDNGIEFLEHWSKSGSNTFTGTGVAIDVTGDTLFKETLKLELIDGVPYYVATVPKNPGPVLFRLAEAEGRKAVFENREHDFPQRIRYELDAQNVLQIRLDGVEAGKPKVERLKLTRISESVPGVK
ncbi:MAG: hypothetical protein IM638_19150 [Bacteroidetes bacterium]|nr:hypothetical protein [Bacteroidota bacterium]